MEVKIEIKFFLEFKNDFDFAYIDVVMKKGKNIMWFDDVSIFAWI